MLIAEAAFDALAAGRSGDELSASTMQIKEGKDGIPGLP